MVWCDGDLTDFSNFPVSICVIQCSYLSGKGLSIERPYHLWSASIMRKVLWTY